MNMELDLAEPGLCCPEPSMAPPTVEKKFYPTLHLSHETEYEFPDDGEMTVVFHKVSSTESETNGKKRYSCTLEVRKITDMEAVKKSKTSNREAEDALDALMKEKRAGKASEYGAEDED